MTLMAHAVPAFKVLGLLHTGYYWNPRELRREVAQVHRHGVVHFYSISSIGTDRNGWVTDPYGNWCVHTVIGRNRRGDLIDRFSCSACPNAIVYPCQTRTA